jgi:hypothetical protein
MRGRGRLNTRLRGALLALSVSSAWAWAAPSEAQTAPFGRREPLLPLRLDGHVAMTWKGALGIGGRADLPLISGTFEYSPRDELAVSLGADATFASFDGESGMELFPTAALQWSIGVNDRLAFVPEIGLIAHVDESGWDRLLLNLGFGTRYYLHRSFGVQARFGWPIAVTAGVVF